MINEAPTWRADQQPYGACATAATRGRAPGTPSGMIEHRLVVIQA